MNKKIKIFIIFSVMLNVLFLGMVGGRALRPHPGFDHEKPIREILAKAPIPAERKQFLENQVGAIFENGQQGRKEADKMRDETFKILTAENFDETAYRTQMEKMFESRSGQRKNMNEAIITLAKQLNVQERLALAEMLRNMPRRR